MDCSFVSVSQDGGWEHPVVMAWIRGCSQSLLRADLAPKTGMRRARLFIVMYILEGEMRFESCYLLFRVMEFHDKLRVGLALLLA